MPVPQIELVTPPAVEPLTKAEVRAHLSEPDEAWDTYIEGELIPAARRYAERETDRQLITQDWKQITESFPCGREMLEIFLSPVQQIVAVTYIDTDGNEQTLAAENYKLVGKSGRAYVALTRGNDWPATDSEDPEAVVVTCRCGFGDASTDVPDDLRLAMKQLIAHWFVNREAVAMSSVSHEVELATGEVFFGYRPRKFL